MKTKICTKCGVEKSLDAFHVNSRAKDGKNAKCKECRSEQRIQHYKDNPEHYAKYYQDNKEILCARVAQYHKDHPEIVAKSAHNARAKRKGWGNPISINKIFKNSECHHLHIDGDHTICINIPKELHRSVWHSSNKPETMDEINEIAMEWYYEYGYKL